MSHHFRRYSKRELLGSLHVDCILSLSDLGLAPGTNRWEVLRAFLDCGEARAERLIEDKDGFLILQSIPGRRNTGAIYVYRESLGAFFWISFGERQDDLSGEDFQNALRIYKLVRFIADPQKHGYRVRRGIPHKWPLLEEKQGETKEERRSCLKGVNCDGQSYRVEPGSPHLQYPA